MSFVSGSHRCGVLGNYRNYDLGDALDTFPELRELTRFRWRRLLWPGGPTDR